MALTKVQTGIINATGTADSTTFLRGDGTWAAAATSGPAFSVYASVNQTVSDATITKVTFDTEEFDTNNNFASSRFTPTVSGYYQINITINCSQSAQVDTTIWLYKNGSQYKRGFGMASSSTKIQFPLSTIVYCNGTTDYLEAYIYTDGTGNGTINGGDTQSTYFNGFLARSA